MRIRWANFFLSRCDYSYSFPPHPLRGEDSCQLSSMISSLCFARSQPRFTAWEKSGQGVWDLSMSPRDCFSQGDLCKGRRSVLEKSYSASKMSSLQNHTYKSGYNEKDWPNQALARMWSKWNSHALLLEMWSGGIPWCPVVRDLCFHCQGPCAAKHTHTQEM